MPTGYRHTQIGRFMLTAYAVALAGTVALGFWLGWTAPLLAALAILSAAAVVFSSLTVEIGDGFLECRFGSGLIRRRFALADVREARPVRNRWYYGWGIRWTPTGWMFNLSGLDAVEITLASGKAFRIGTDQPEELTAALRRAIS